MFSLRWKVLAIQLAICGGVCMCLCVFLCEVVSVSGSSNKAKGRPILMQKAILPRVLPRHPDHSQSFSSACPGNYMPSGKKPRATLFKVSQISSLFNYDSQVKPEAFGSCCCSFSISLHMQYIVSHRETGNVEMLGGGVEEEEVKLVIFNLAATK